MCMARKSYVSEADSAAAAAALFAWRSSIYIQFGSDYQTPDGLEIGQVLSCGSNAFGQLGVPHGPRRCVVPQAVEWFVTPVPGELASSSGLCRSRYTCVTQLYMKAKHS
ncbi:secretion-regulating guanine nucleotide exchange factor [Cricetulus griseus]|uniref:Secretion-regulating guanine nucleotide exchange factor n=1 Tax=Cricetulus griseus TaxID=10029 RepID=A0A061HWP4_CRIGR|nr:secretion-regulating guanine nucleotide exchange factor [Cricetulus griseus]